MEKKKLSEFLKENSVYESFIENCLREETTLQYFAEHNLSNIGISNGFTWIETSEGIDYWEKLYDKLGELNIIYDMDEILYKEYAKRSIKKLSEQNPTTKDIVEKDTETKAEDIKQESKPFTLNIEINNLDEAKSLGNKYNLDFLSLYEAIHGK